MVLSKDNKLIPHEPVANGDDFDYIYKSNLHIDSINAAPLFKR